MRLFSTHYTEIGFALEGIYVPGEAECRPSLSSGGDPGHPASVDDITITALTYTRNHYTYTKSSDNPFRIITNNSPVVIDLTDEVDLSNPEVQKLLNNIITALDFNFTRELLNAREE